VASTRHAPEATQARRDTYGSGIGHLGDTDLTTEFPRFDATVGDMGGNGAYAVPTAYGPQHDGPYEEWNPTADSVRPVRGRHRVAKQRGGMARSGAVLGVGMIAAVGAGGMAGAKEKPASISVADMSSLAGSVAEELPSGIGDLVPGIDSADTTTVAAAPLTQAGFTTEAAPEGAPGGDAGESLRARILAQAAQQQSAADATAREEAAAFSAAEAAEAAAKKAEAEREAEAERKREAAEEARRKAEAARLAELARSYSVPLSSYTLSSSYGAGGSMWENDHTGQDFAAQTGTPVMAVHGGTVKEAGWAGSYGYRIVLELDDGTEVWYCHLSSMNVSAGAEVNTKDVIGNVGSTGNSTGPHLHLEVRPGGGSPVDPLAWLRGKGLSV
jgi:murein DD-endopeptidase MepM/ murein hydrolase activator NlpD